MDVMINCICQFVNLTGSWGDGILFWVCWWGFFWMRLTFESVTLTKAVPSVIRAGSSKSMEGLLERKGWQNSSWLTVKLGCGLQLSDSDRSPSCSLVWSLLTFGLEFYHWLSWFSDFWIWTGTIPLSLPSLQLAKGRSCNSSASIIVGANSLYLK